MTPGRVMYGDMGWRLRQTVSGSGGFVSSFPCHQAYLLSRNHRLYLWGWLCPRFGFSSSSFLSLPHFARYLDIHRNFSITHGFCFLVHSSYRHSTHSISSCSNTHLTSFVLSFTTPIVALCTSVYVTVAFSIYCFVSLNYGSLSRRVFVLVTGFFFGTHTLSWRILSIDLLGLGLRSLSTCVTSAAQESRGD